MSVQQEGIEYLIDAEDRATAKVRAVTENIERQAAAVRETGSQAKASTELVGTFAAQLGGEQIGAFAGEIAQLTERVQAFSEVSQLGSAGAFAFKAGLAGAAGIISFKIGKAIGDIVFQTDRWNKELEKALETAKALDQELVGRFMENVTGDLDVVNANLRGLTARLQAIRNEQKQVEEENIRSATEGGLFNLQIQSTERFAGEIDQLKTRIKLLNEERRKLLQEPAETENASRKIIEDLGKQLQLEEMIGDEKLKQQLIDKGVVAEDLQTALELQKELIRLEQEKENEKELARQKELAAEKEKLRLKREEIEVSRQAIRENQTQLRELQKQLAGVNQERSTTTGANQAGQNQRLLTGAAGARFQKTAETIELERQTKQQAKIIEIQSKIDATLQRIERSQQTLKVISDG